jgi:hypothetical protein
MPYHIRCTCGHMVDDHTVACHYFGCHCRRDKYEASESTQDSRVIEQTPASAVHRLRVSSGRLTSP